MELKSDTAAEKSKDQLSRDFPGRSIFAFCNNIGTNRKWPNVRLSPLSGEELKSNFGPSGPLMTPNRKSPAVASGRAVVPPI